MTKIKRGLTLVELIIVLSLMGLVATLTFSLITFSNKSFKISSDEYNLQANARLIAKKTNDSIKYATAVFAIPQASFNKRPLTDKWNYIGTVQDGNKTKIVNYVWNPSKGEHGGHDEIVILETADNIKYVMEFSKLTSHTEDKLLNYKIEASINGGNPINVLSKVENLNALQIIDYGSASNPSTAIAYRNDERPVVRYIANVGMVLDNSGSMSYKMGNTDSNIRIVVLKSKASELIGNFATAPNVDVCLVPFSNNANISNGDYTFYNASTNMQDLIGKINNMGANGGTNTGDGMRRAYYALYKKDTATKNLGLTPLNYMIILVDGETTYASGKKVNNIYNYYEGEGNYNSIIGNGSDSTKFVQNYDDRIGKIIDNNNSIKVYLIGMCSNLSNVQRIGNSCGATGIYTASNTGELKAVFDKIKDDIFKDLWYLDGPRL